MFLKRILISFILISFFSIYFSNPLNALTANRQINSSITYTWSTLVSNVADDFTLLGAIIDINFDSDDNYSINSGVTLTFNQDIDGTYSQNLTGAGNFTKSGNSSLSVNNPNTITGTLRVNDGVYRANSGSGLSTNDVRVASGASFFINNRDYNNSSRITRIAGSGHGNVGALYLEAGGEQYYNSRINLTADATIGVDNGETLRLFDSDNDFVLAHDTFTTNGFTITFGDGTSANNGTVELEDRIALHHSSNNNAGSVVVADRFTLDVEENNIFNSGRDHNLTVYGTLQFSNDDDSQSEGSSNVYNRLPALTIDAGRVKSTTNFTKNSTNYPSVSLDGTVTVTNNDGNTSYLEATNSEGIGLGYGSSEQITFNIGSGATLDTTAKLVNGIADYTSSTISRVTGGIIKSGAGTLDLGGANTYSGATTVRAGTLLVSGSISSSSQVNITDSSTTSSDTPQFLIQLGTSNDSDIVVNNNSTASNPVIGSSGSGNSVATFSGDITLNRNVTFHDAGTDRTTFTGAISSSNNDITITGTRVTLDNSNSISGATFDVTDGSILQLGNEEAIGSSSTLNTVDLNSTGKLYINGGAGSSFFVGGLTGSGGTVQRHTGGTETINIGNNNDNSFGGVISGSDKNGSAATINVVKVGSGIQTLSGTNTYTGNTTVSSGTLEISGTLGLGNYAGDISNSGTLSFSSSSAQDLTGDISGTGALTKSGSGEVILSGVASYTGNTTVNAGKLWIKNTFGNSDITVNSGGVLLLVDSYDDSSSTGTIDINSGGEVRIETTVSNNITISGVGSGDLSPTGAIITTGGSPSITGLVTLDGDATVAARSSGLSFNVASGNAFSGTGDLTLFAQQNITVNDPIAITGDVIKDGSQTLYLYTDNSYSGATVVKNGSLTIGSSSAGSIPTSTVLTFKDGGAAIVTFNRTSGTTIGGIHDAEYISSSNQIYGSSNGSDFTINVASGENYSSSAALDGDNYTLSDELIKTGAGSQELSGQIAGFDGIKVQAGTLTLSGGNTFSGNITVSSGATLEAGFDSAFSSATVVLNSGAKLSANNTIPRTLSSNDITLTGTVTLGDATKLGNLGLGDATLLADTTVIVESGVEFNALSGNYNFIKNGAGTLTIASVPSTSNTTTVNAGTLLSPANGDGNGTFLRTGQTTVTGGELIFRGSYLGNQPGGAPPGSSTWNTAIVMSGGKIIFESSNVITDTSKGITGSGGIIELTGNTSPLNASNIYYRLNNATINNAIQRPSSETTLYTASSNNWNHLGQFTVMGTGDFTMNATLTSKIVQNNGTFKAGANFDGSNGAVSIKANDAQVLGDTSPSLDLTGQNLTISVVELQDDTGTGTPSIIDSTGSGSLTFTSLNVETGNLPSGLADDSNGDDIIYSPTISANSTISAKLAGSGTVYLRQNAILNLTSDSSAYTGDFSFDGQKSHLNISSGQIGTQTIDMLSTPVAVNETTLTIGATSLAHSTPFIKVGALDTINFQGSNTNAITLISFVNFIDNGDGTYIGDNLDFPNRIVIADNVTATFNIPSSYTETVRTGETVKTLSETFNRMIITSGTNSAIKFTGSGTLNFDGFADVWTDTDDDDIDDTVSPGFSGDIIIAGPTVNLENNDEIANTSDVTVESGTLNFGSNTDTINNLTVSGGTVSGSGTLTALGNINVSGGTVSIRSLNGAYQLSGGTVNSLMYGSTLTVTGNTTTTNSSFYSGATSVNSGTLTVTGTGFGTTGAATTVASGASVHIDRSGKSLQNYDEVFNLSGTGVSNSGALQATGAVTLTGAINLNADTRIVTNSGGTLVISNTSTGIDGSSGNYNLTLAGAGDMTVSGPINLGTGTLTKGVTGTLTLSGALTVGSISDLNRATIAANITTSNNQTYSGGADIGPGTITLTSSSGNVTFSDTVRGIGTSPKPTVSIDGNLVLNSGANVESSVGVLSVTGTSSLAANVTTATTQSYTGAITLTADSTLTGTTITAANINNDGNNLTINTTASNSAITGVFSGSGNLTKSGSGNLTLSGTNTSTGDVTVSAGTLTVSGSLDDTSDVTVASGATYSVGASDTIGSLSGAGTTALGSNNLTLGSNSSTTYSGTLTGSGNLVKSGTGQLTLSGTSSSFTGGVNITGGKVSVSSSANLGATPGSADADNITLNGGTLKSTAEFTLGTNKGITLGSSGGTIETATSASDILTYGGVITGSGNLTKTGNGILLLSGDNTYTGTTTISSGKLRLSGSLDSTTINISGNGTQMQVNSVNGLSSSASISIGTGSTLALNENNTINSVSGTGKIRVNNNKELTVSSTTFTGLVVGSGDLVVDGSYTIGGSGNMQLGDNGADNDINTIVSGASTTLNIGSNNALSTTHNLTVQNNAAFNMGAFQQTVSTVDLTEGTISGTSSGELEATTEIALKSGEVAANTNLAGSVPLNKTTGGTVDFKGKAKHTGATNISAGTMNVTGSIENTSAVNVSGGTLKLNSTNAVHSSAGINVTGGALEVLENITVGDFEASGGTVTLGSGKQLTINPTTNLKQITGLTGSGKFKKTGSQTTILTGTNSYTGETRVSGGILRINSSTALSSSTDVVVESGTILDVNSDITVDTVSDAGDVDVASGSTFTVSDSENKTFAGRLRGSGNFAKTGSSTMTLTGQSDLSGTVTVSGGVLYAGNASSGSGTTIIDNDVTVSGGKLGGGGRISGTVTVNSGSLVPGNSIGTLYIGGNLDLTSSSTTEIEFNASASDKIVVSGDITVAGTIILKPENVTYASTSYVIIDGSSDTSKNFSGSFSTVTVSPTSNLNGATASLTYNNALQQVILNLTASSSDPSDDGDSDSSDDGDDVKIKAKSSKQKTLADIFDKDTANSIASSELKTYWKSLDSVVLDKELNKVKGTVLATSLVQTQKIHNSFQKALTNVTAMGATSTVGNITRSSGSNLTLAQIQEAGLFKDKNKWSEHWDYSDKSVLGFFKNNKNKTILSGKTSQDRAVFIRTYGGQTKRDDIGSTFTGYKNDTFGILFGEQIRVASNVFSGYSFGFSGSDTDYNDNNGESRAYAAHASVFKQFDNKKNNVNLIAGGYISNTDSDRKVIVGEDGEDSAVNDTYNSEMTDIGINATAQYTHKLNVGSWNFSPTVSLQGSYEIKDDTKEKGSGNFALNVKNDDLMTLKPEIGFSLDKDFSKLEEERNQFNFSVFASQDHYLDGTKSTANYASNPSNSFQLKTPRDEETYLSAGIGYNYVNDAKKTNFIANAFYSENTDNDLESNIISITYRKLFGDFGKDGLPPIVAEKPEDDEDGVIDQAIKTVKKALVFKKPSCNEGQVYRAFECGPSEETLQLVANKLYEINKREPTLRDKMLSWYISISYYLPLITFIMFVILIYEVLRGFVIASFRIDNRRIVVRKNKPGFIAFVKNYFNENFEYI